VRAHFFCAQCVIYVYSISTCTAADLTTTQKLNDAVKRRALLKNNNSSNTNSAQFYKEHPNEQQLNNSSDDSGFNSQRTSTSKGDENVS
jgi:hypothetical protein